ncbi:UNVERIFIED_CONTAM: DNA polymerase, partial [Kocuria sp. CPCC 205274]
LGSDKRLVIYVHNLAYEFQFMRKYFEWEEVFSIKERKPIRALTVDGVEFRDSYILSGMSLATVANNLTKHKVAKLEGDLDYSLPRHQKTELTAAEMAYCNNDIEIILAYIREQLDECNITEIPMTNTGRVRQYVKSRCFTEINKETGEEFRNPRDYQAIMKKLTLTPDVYKMAKRAFIGGFTHSNPEHSMKVMENVSSVDLTSSYPTVMIAEEYPMGSPVQLMLDSLEDFRKASAKYCIMLDVAFVGLRNKIGYESYISESKAVKLEGAEIVNGRVYSADLLTMTLVDVDLEIISAVYEWDELHWENVWAFKKYYLPKAIIQSILALYQDKTTLKDVKGREVDYLRSKGMLNSIYGMCVTDIVKDDHIYDDVEGWGIEETDVKESIQDYN